MRSVGATRLTSSPSHYLTSLPVQATLSNALRTNPAHPVAEQQERDEADRQRDAHRQQPDDALAAPGIAIQEDQCREQRGDDRDQDRDDDDFHDGSYSVEKMPAPCSPC